MTINGLRLKGGPSATLRGAVSIFFPPRCRKRGRFSPRNELTGKFSNKTRKAKDFRACFVWQVVQSCSPEKSRLRRSAKSAPVFLVFFFRMKPAFCFVVSKGKPFPAMPEVARQSLLAGRGAFVAV